MGFDLTGKHPKSARGEYFRASIHYWPRLWDFCATYCPDAAALGSAAYHNDGAEMTAEAAERLAQAIRAKVADGTAQKFAAGYIPAPDPMQKWLEENFGDCDPHDADIDPAECLRAAAMRGGASKTEADELLRKVGLAGPPKTYQDKLQELADFAADSGGFVIA